MLYEDIAGSYSVVLGPQYDETKREKITSADCGARGVKITVNTSRKTDGSVEMLLSVYNGTDRELSEVVFPDVELEIKGEESGFTMPVGPGWWQPFTPLDEGEYINWNFPIFGAMQWTDYGDENSGVYIGTHDKLPYIKLVRVGKRNGKPWVMIRWTDIQLMPGESFDLPPVVVWEHQGDWHEAAKFYRAWAESWMEKPSGAEWYDEAPAWSWFGFKGQLADKPGRMYSGAPAGAVANSQFGVKLLNAGGWSASGHDAHYPDYWAGEDMGGAEGLTQAIEDIHKLGLRMSLYTNGRIADPNGSLGSMPGWLGWAVQAPNKEALVPEQQLHSNFTPGMTEGLEWNVNGTAETEKYGKVDFTVMCPSCKEWRELFISRLEVIARDYKADGTFIDQINGCWALPCYSTEHDHHRPNESWHGYLTLCKELRARLRSHNPHFQMSTEGVCDIFGQYFDVQQGHNDWDTQVGTKANPLPELYSYTFPWYTINTGWASRDNYYYLKLAHAVGSGLDICDVAGDNPEERFKSLVTQIMAWRSQFADVLRRGEFIGKLKADNPHYLAHAFEKDGRIVITTGWVPYKCNPEMPKSVTLKLENQKISGARLFTEDGEKEVEITGNRIKVPVSEIGVLVVS